MKFMKICEDSMVWGCQSDILIFAFFQEFYKKYIRFLSTPPRHPLFHDTFYVCVTNHWNIPPSP